MVESAYVPVPVEAAAAIGVNYKKSVVIVCCWDRLHGLLHTTTWGDDAQEKAWAADGGDLCTKSLGFAFEARSIFDDYRLINAGQRARALALCKQACVAASHILRSLLASRGGATDELLREVLGVCEQSVAVVDALKPEVLDG